MVATTAMAWLSYMRPSITTDSRRHSCAVRSDKPATLGILAFETAKSMCRLLALYKSLSEDEILKLRKQVMLSEGVSYLNSKDQGFLLYLACAEILEDLDSIAVVIARLGRKCSDFGLAQFDLVYNDWKMGIVDLSKVNSTSKDIDKMIDKMERLLSTTSNLYSALECLTEMEISERKLQMWKKNIPQKANFDLFDEKISWHRRQVRQLREVSLWNQTFDKTVTLMAGMACVVYARVCVVFGPYISVLPPILSPRLRSPPRHKQHIHLPPENGRASKTGPIKIPPKQTLARCFSPKSALLLAENIGFGVGFGIGYAYCRNIPFDEFGKHNSIFHNAPQSTLGGSGLALRYANVIILAERYLNSTDAIREDAREDLYQMLPECLKSSVRAKLSWRWRKWRKEDAATEMDSGEEEGAHYGHDLAEGWRKALKAMLAWLAPMAHNTVKWHSAKNMEKQRFDARPMAMLLQTLHYSDKEKTETAIAELLVGLSCIYRYENLRSPTSSRRHHCR